MRSHGTKYSTLFVGQYLFLGMQLPFFPGWLDAAGFTGQDIGLVTGIALILRLVLGPLVAIWAERQHDQRLALWLVTGLLAGSALFLPFVPLKLLISILTISMLFAFGCLVPLSDAALLRADIAGTVTYGRIRSVGSAAFVVANLAGGILVTRFGDPAAVWSMAVFALMAFGASFLLPDTRFRERADALTERLKPPSREDVRLLVAAPAFLLILLATGLIQGAHAVYYYFSELHWSALGYSPFFIGCLWTVGVLAEILLLYFARHITARISPILLIALGAAGAAIRWPLTGLSPPPAILILLQMSHALTFAATYLGGVEFVRRAVPGNLTNTAMTLVSAVGVGAITGIASVAAGAIFDRHEPLAAYALMSLMALAALGLCGILRFVWQGGRIAAVSDSTK